MGTDNLGRDIFSRVVYAARVDLQIGLILTYVPLVYGVILGAVAGYFGGRSDSVIMRLVDVVIAFPFIVLVIAILAVVGPGVKGIYIAVLAVAWAMYARLTRAEMLVLREQQFMLAAEALGFSRRRIIFRHAIPNLLRPNLVFSMADFVLNILLVASLSFLGLGVRPPTPSGARWSRRAELPLERLVDRDAAGHRHRRRRDRPQPGRRRSRGPHGRAVPAHRLKQRRSVNA